MKLFFASILFCICLPGTAQQNEIRTQVDSLFSYILDKATESFAVNAVYRGDDTKRKWKDFYNPSNPEELKQAKLLMDKIRRKFLGCGTKEFISLKEEKESEGKWYIYSMSCAGKKIHLAFLKIKGKYALGDVDIEENGD